MMPNPFHDFIVIESRSGVFCPGYLQIYDMHGRVTAEFFEIVIPSKIYLPDFPPGVYLFNVKDDGGKNYSFKVMKN